MKECLQGVCQSVCLLGAPSLIPSLTPSGSFAPSSVRSRGSSRQAGRQADPCHPPPPPPPPPTRRVPPHLSSFPTCFRPSSLPPQKENRSARSCTSDRPTDRLTELPAFAFAFAGAVPLPLWCLPPSLSPASLPSLINNLAGSYPQFHSMKSLRPLFPLLPSS